MSNIDPLQKIIDLEIAQQLRKNLRNCMDTCKILANKIKEIENKHNIPLTSSDSKV